MVVLPSHYGCCLGIKLGSLHYTSGASAELQGSLCPFISYQMDEYVSCEWTDWADETCCQEAIWLYVSQANERLCRISGGAGPLGTEKNGKEEKWL